MVKMPPMIGLGDRSNRHYCSCKLRSIYFEILRDLEALPIPLCSPDSSQPSQTTFSDEMSLSSGTLNLKFMQRGAALKAAAVASSSLSPSTPTKANQSNTSSVPITSQNPTPISSNTQTQTLTETPVSTDTKFDDEERWSLPRRSIPQSIEASTSSSKTRISFESSYLPFLSQGEGSIAHENDNESRDSISAGRQGESSRMGGGGRMAFGGFGSREVERNDTREIDGRSEDMNHGEVKTRRERDEPKVS